MFSARLASARERFVSCSRQKSQPNAAPATGQARRRDVCAIEISGGVRSALNPLAARTAGSFQHSDAPTSNSPPKSYDSALCYLGNQRISRP
jgi:hypothetical protein